MTVTAQKRLTTSGRVTCGRTVDLEGIYRIGRRRELPEQWRDPDASDTMPSVHEKAYPLRGGDANSRASGDGGGRVAERRPHNNTHLHSRLRKYES